MLHFACFMFIGCSSWRASETSETERDTLKAVQIDINNLRYLYIFHLKCGRVPIRDDDAMHCYAYAYGVIAELHYFCK